MIGCTVRSPIRHIGGLLFNRCLIPSRPVLLAQEQRQMADKFQLGFDLGEEFCTLCMIPTDLEQPPKWFPADGSRVPAVAVFDATINDWRCQRPSDVGMPAVPVLELLRLSTDLKEGSPTAEDVIKRAQRITGLGASILRCNAEGFVELDINGRSYPVHTIASRLIKDLLVQAENAWGFSTGLQTPAVVGSFPRPYGDIQREVMKRAFTEAGANHLRTIPCTLAACLAHRLDRCDDGEQEVLVWQFDESNLTVCCYSAEDGIFEIVGERQFPGGSVFTDVVADLIKAKASTELEDALLQKMAEKAKIALTTEDATVVQLSNDASLTLCRADVEAEYRSRILTPLCREVQGWCASSVRNPNRSDGPFQGKKTVLLGTTANIPAVREVINQVFSGVLSGENPSTLVALGCAIQARVLTSDTKTEMGCMLEFTPLHLGIATIDGRCATVVPRNYTIPTRQRGLFTTSKDNQTAVQITLMEGGRPWVEECNTLHTMTLAGIPPCPAGTPQIRIEVDIDVNGMLLVEATLESPNEGQAVTTSSDRFEAQRITFDEIKAMMLQGNINEKEDKERLAAMALLVNALPEPPA